MVVVPAGSFMLQPVANVPPGAPAPILPPPHVVHIAQSVAVGRFEITRGEFARFVRLTHYQPGNRCFVFQRLGDDGVGVFGRVDGRSWRNPGYPQSDQHPVVCVSWQDAQAYIKWINEQTHQHYRLLSESEWAYVTSAGAGHYRPNGFGIHDLLGNAWEWMEDCGGSDFAVAPTDGSPALSGNGGFRVACNL
jgi:formylglycine-generating enzyme required for sulfatase activity